MPTSVCEHKWGMRDWGEPEKMPKSGLFGICLVKHMPSIGNIFFFEVQTLNGSHSTVHQIFATQTNAVRSAWAIRPHRHFSHFHMPHSAFAYRCGFTFRGLCASVIFHPKKPVHFVGGNNVHLVTLVFFFFFFFFFCRKKADTPFPLKIVVF